MTPSFAIAGAFLFLALAAHAPSGLVLQTKVPVKPIPLSLKDMVAQDPADAVPVKHNMFPVTIMTHHDRLSQWLQTEKKDWEASSLKVICERFKAHGGKGNLVDAGANIGTFTLPLAACLRDNGKGKHQVLLSVEPNPNNLPYLRAGIKVNALDNVRLFENALSSPTMPDMVRMQLQSSEDPKLQNEGMAHVMSARDGVSHGHVVEVPKTTFDQLLGTPQLNGAMNNVFAMKVDIEGSEVKALEGATELMSVSPPCLILVEDQKRNSDAAKRNQVPRMLEEYGYELDEDFEKTKAPTVAKRLKVPNKLFHLKDFAACVARLK